VFEWSKTNVFSTLYICWGAQAGLYYFYGIDKIPLTQKLFGIFEQRISRKCFLFRGFDDTYYCPQSRWTGIDETKLKDADLHVISRGISPKIDNYANLIEDKNHRRVFVMGHLEYVRWTLDAEYKRDAEQGIDIQVPYNYYADDDSNKNPKISWRAHATLFFNNWVNFVYQETEFDLDKLRKLED
jgi:homoserine O-succinyltransferase